MWDGFNQRNFPRISVRCRISLIPHRSKGSLDAFTRNIGLGGVCVYLEKSFRTLQQCQLKMDLGKKYGFLEAKAQVVWVVPTQDERAGKRVYDTGFEFLEISDEMKVRLQYFLDLHLQTDKKQ